MKIVALKDVKKTYMLGQTEVNALKGVSFEIEKGDFVAIAGPSGAGKSTILNMIGCIDIPTEGTVHIDREDISTLSDRRLTSFRLHKLGFIFQSFNLIPVLNVYENIEFPLLLKRDIPKRERDSTIHKLIEEVGLKDRIKNKPAELSGGQRQRVAIARALVTSPLIILADEPTANLDSETGHRIVELMKEINRTEHTTFVFSTHDPHIMEHANHVIKLRDGMITAE